MPMSPIAPVLVRPAKAYIYPDIFDHLPFARHCGCRDKGSALRVVSEQEGKAHA